MRPCTGQVFLTVLIILQLVSSIEYEIPDAQFQALKNGGFRMILKAEENARRLTFSGKINGELDDKNARGIAAQIDSPENGYFIKEYPYSLRIGDNIAYRAFLLKGRLGYRRDFAVYTITGSDFFDSYPNLKVCKASTTITGGTTACIDDFIIFDEFNGGSVNMSVWTIEQRIPTYTGFNAEMNSYENREDTMFLNSGILFIKPIAITNPDHLRGVLDLTEGCTSNRKEQCIFAQRGAFTIPPVKSAMITSKVSFRYGHAEIRAQLPIGDWIVPVMELKPTTDDNHFVPKIVIAFSRGNRRLTGPNTGNIEIGNSLLYAGTVLEEGDLHTNPNLKTRSRGELYGDGFHTYAVKWLPDNLTFLFDGEKIETIDVRNGWPNWNNVDQPFKEECILSLGVAIGGLNNFPDNYVSNGNPRPWDYNEVQYATNFYQARDLWLKTWKGDDTALKIDYVKVRAV